MTRLTYGLINQENVLIELLKLRQRHPAANEEQLLQTHHLRKWHRRAFCRLSENQMQLNHPFGFQKHSRKENLVLCE